MFKVGDVIKRITCDSPDSRIKVGDILTVSKLDRIILRVKEIPNRSYLTFFFVKIGISNPNNNIIIKE